MFVPSNEKSIQEKNLEYLAKEIHKSVNGSPPLIKGDIFTVRKNSCSLCNFKVFILQAKELKIGNLNLLIDYLKY